MEPQDHRRINSTIKSISRISRRFEGGDQRYYNVPCPHCDEPHVLKFANLKWDKDEAGNHRPETAHFICPHCGTQIDEEHKVWMIEEADRRARAGDARYGWVATKPSRGHASFHIWTAYSLFPNATWANIATEFLAAHRSRDPLNLQAFVNTVLGEEWEDAGERVDDSKLLARREDYEEIPMGGLVVCAGVDVQADRVEIERVAFGVADETWGMGKVVILGDPTGTKLWDDLDAYLAQPLKHASGIELPILATTVDCGYLTQTVARWCHERWGRRIYAVKGTPGPGRPLWPKKPTKIKGGYRIFSIGVDSGKEVVHGRLRHETPGPGYSHFNFAYDADHFEQLTAEEAVRAFVRGLPVRRWQLRPGQLRNEALDIRVYAHAAFEGMRAMGLKLKVHAERIARAAALRASGTEPVRSAPAPQQPRVAAPQQPAERIEQPRHPAPPRKRKRMVVRSRFLG